MVHIPRANIHAVPHLTARQQGWLIGGAIAIFIAALVGVGWWQFAAPTAPVVYTGPTYPKVTSAFQTSFFQQAPYPDLRKHGAYPIEPGVTGRGNPFSLVSYEQASTTPVLESLFGQLAVPLVQ
jgi:hypothetical protein